MLFKKTNKHCNAQVVFMIAHKFLQNRFEVNKRTHNYNYQKYGNAIIKISKSSKAKIIDMRNKLITYPARKYCLPLPDGLHLNNFGSLKYIGNTFANVILAQFNLFIFNYIKNFLFFQ